jgi:lipopolysaccharide export LptBFGC system permease protein LptF
MDEAKKQYTEQLREYDRVIDQAIQTQDLSQLPKIRELNAAIAKTLNKMIEDITFLKKDTPDIKKTRDELIARLRTIQKDYNGLLTNTDQLETLRRIRQQESREAERELYWYLIFFLLVALAIVLFVLFFSSQRKEATAASASIPPTAAALV